MSNLVITRDETTGEGHMAVHPDATPAEIGEAHKVVEESGWEVLDFEETGDLYDYDDDGFMNVPLAFGEATALAFGVSES